MTTGLLVIVSAPSGAGKTTLIRRLLETETNCLFAISHTTRGKREGEGHGVDYYFVTDEQFDRMIADGAFAEWAHVHDNRYGTSLAEVERLTGQGHDVVFDVDYQGARSLSRRFPGAVSVFILPPSMAEVKKRLQLRHSEDADSLALRMRDARIDIAAAAEYRYVVVNDDLDRAMDDIMSILRASRLATPRASALLKALLAEEVEGE